MAIAFDTASGSAAGIANSLTWAHACTGADILWVGVTITTSNDEVTGVTYNGVPMTLGLYDSFTWSKYLFYLLAPAAGAHDVVVSVSAFRNIAAAAASYSGARQSGVPDATATASGVGVTSRTATLTTVADNCWSVLFAGDESADAETLAGTGSTRRFETHGAAFGANGAFFDSNGAITPAGSYGMTFTQVSPATLHGIAASFAPAGGGGTTPRSLFRQANLTLGSGGSFFSNPLT